jgi:hypothetical protein
LAPIFWGPPAAELESSGSSTSSIDSGDDEISPLCFTKPADSGKLVDLFGRMMFGSTAEADPLQGTNSDNFTNFDLINNTNFTVSGEVFAEP